jgi:RHS repeat-associated protein
MPRITARIASMSINGVLQGSYRYDFAGRQAIRVIATNGVTIHSVFDSQGRRIAEYNEATGALIREYVWLGWEPVAVIEGGVVSYIRTDHIGRPVFATNSTTGVKTWTASYDPFGGVRTVTGAPIAARFPGQWFQAESGLHQNWMRDYDPTTGRYLQADPLGLVDGASVYGYARQSPGRYTDPRGLYTLGDAENSLIRRGGPRDGWAPGPFGGGPAYSDSQVFDEWLDLERGDRNWLSEIPSCPCNMSDADPSEWGNPNPASQLYHPGAIWELRSNSHNGHGNQCTYDAQGKLISSPPGAGSADYRAPIGLGVIGHFYHDVETYNRAWELDRINDYFSVRPVVSEPCCE